ncbi:MAG: hypothetical protein GY931_10945 [Maribacter sp.]|nr:hypothetical protein [Maribacter sp.]
MFTGLSCSNNNIVHLKLNDSFPDIDEYPVSMDLIEFEDWLQSKDIGLYQNTESGLESVPFQINENKLRFLHKGMTNGYIIKKGDIDKSKVEVSAQKEEGNLVMSIQEKPRLIYRYGISYPPKGIDTIYRKSGYIHPILSPKGDTLSRIQPPDHFHHYGMWGPWTHTRIKGEQVDFWNLGDGKGTVLFKNFNSTTSGPIFASFSAAQEHLDFITEKEPQVALDENLKITLWNLNRRDRYMFDYKSSFKSPLENGILFEAYRYGGGIGMRFTERWTAENCSVLTSEGKDRLSADGTNARWCIVKGESSDGKSTNGILFMSHSKNRSHPEPMRIWPIDANGGRGDMFFEFCPIRHEEWKIEPQKEYQLKYRMVVFEDDLTAKEAEEYWQSFVNAPKMSLIKD